ncbi:MAG: class I SAM-dependent methyltransferase [Rhizobiaceae bacterium]
MAEKTSGIYRLITIPKLYAFFQDMLGGQAARGSFKEQYFNDVAGKKVLEIGCGPGASYPILSDSAEFIGVDWNAEHIKTAQEKFGSGKASFVRGDVRTELSMDSGRFDYVFAFGLLHHLDDNDAKELLIVAHDYLCTGGKFVSVDPVYHKGQNWFAKWMCDRDSGQNVRTAERYQSLFPEQFNNVCSNVSTDKLRIPYSHCVMVATKG